MKISEIAGKYPVMKMQGCGNDFIVIYDNKQDVTSDMARNLCRLHYGIGSDGLIAVTSSRKKDAMFRMKFFNPDGSTAEMCGNGIRCFAKYLADNKMINTDEEIAVDTDAGLIKCGIINNDEKKASVKVNMGMPVFYNEKQISVKPDNNGYVRGKAKGLDYTFVSMGNPHAVIFTQTPEQDVKKYGEMIEKDTGLFPCRTNVEFVRVNSKDDLTMFVWERGAGETLACGTGACASFAAAFIGGLSDSRAVIHLAGGDLTIEWHGINHPLYMTGEAVNVFKIDAASLDKFI